MRIKIRVKGVSNREKKIQTIIYEYEDRSYTVKEFLEETVMITLKMYRDEAEKKISSSKDYYERSEDTVRLLKVLSKEEIEDRKESGKVSFGVLYGDTNVNIGKACENAVQCFEDGMVALFLNEERYENLNEIFPVKEESEVVFVRLTFLAGRMW